MHLFAFLFATVISDFGWLTGGTWSADASALPGGVKEIQTRYEWTPNRAFIRFTTAFVEGSDANGSVGYAGDLYFDPKDGQCKAWYVDEKNEISSGTMTLNGNEWDMAIAPYKVAIQIRDQNHYTWTLEQPSGSDWKKLFSLEYYRR